MRNHRRRRISVRLVDHHRDVVRRKHLQRADEGRLGQRMGVDAHEEGAIDPGLAPVVAQRLADRQNMRLVEGIVEGRTAMPGGAERDAL